MKKDSFLVKYGFLIFSSILAVSLVVLMKISWQLLPANITEEVVIGDFEHEISLKGRDTILLPNELLMVDVISEDVNKLISGNIHVNFPGSLLKLVRASGTDSVMNNKGIAMKLNVTSSLFHGADISFANPSLNGLEVESGKLMTLYFVAKGVGEGDVKIDYSNSLLEDNQGRSGVTIGDVGVDFRVE